MNEILAGLFQLKIPIPDNPLGFTNTYLLKGEDGYLLIDAGFNSQEAFEALQKQLDDAGAGIDKITRLVITHAHGDHIGLAGRIRDLSGAKILMHRLEKPQRPPARIDHTAFMKQNEKWLHASGMPYEEFPPPSRPRGGGQGQVAGEGPLLSSHHPPGAMGRLDPPARPDVTLDDGDRIPWAGGLDLQVLWTPGHSPGHICLYESNRRLLFAGDHVLPVTTPNIGLRPGQNGRTNPLGDFLRSLDRVRDLEVTLVLPAHERTFADLPRRVDEMKEHHRHRNHEILETLASGPKTAYQVSEGITWMPESGGVRFHDLHHWHRRMAVSETLAHLEALRASGAIRRFLNNSVVYYQLTAR